MLGWVWGVIAGESWREREVQGLGSFPLLLSQSGRWFRQFGYQQVVLLENEEFFHFAKLRVHVVVYKKMTSRQLLVSKIRVSGHVCDFSLGFFIAHLEYLKNFVVILALRFQRVNIGFDGG
jgi:hypothetical protein